jgi:hypothetical protein
MSFWDRADEILRSTRHGRDLLDDAVRERLTAEAREWRRYQMEDERTSWVSS